MVLPLIRIAKVWWRDCQIFRHCMRRRDLACSETPRWLVGIGPGPTRINTRDARTNHRSPGVKGPYRGGRVGRDRGVGRDLGVALGVAVGLTLGDGVGVGIGVTLGVGVGVGTPPGVTKA